MKIGASRLIDGITVIAALAGIAGAAYVLATEHPLKSGRIADVTQREWRVANRGGSILGDPRAPVMIVEFADFQCPFCGAMRAPLDSLRQRHPDVAVRFRHLPLSNAHASALPAAVAAQCAGEQGQFGAYHDALYVRQRELSELDWTALADAVGGLDTAAFRTCLTSESVREAIARDIADAQQLELAGTPVFFVGDRRFLGGMAAQELEDAVSGLGLRKREN